jgi:hypothetical protein
VIGNWEAKFAIVGINPGSSEDCKWKCDEYISYYSNPQKCGLGSKDGWRRGYFEAYRMLVTRELTIDNFRNFNENAVILNIIKCSTENIRKLDGKRYESARKNCIGYLKRQLDLILPKVILVHGKSPCVEIIDMLKDNSRYKVVKSTTAIDVLTAKIIKPYSMDTIGKEWVLAKDNSGREVLFLFNWHLSRWGPAKKSLEQNLEEKRRMIDIVLRH